MSSIRRRLFFLKSEVTFRERVMPKTELDGLPVIESDESEEITVAVKPEDLEEGDKANPEQHPIAIALRRQRGIDDARLSKREVLIKRGDHSAHRSACLSAKKLAPSSS